MPPRPTAIRVLLVDDHAMVRRGMRDFLALHDDLEIVGDAADGAEAMEQVAALRPDVVVMDLLMPGIVTRRMRTGATDGDARDGSGASAIGRLTARERDVLAGVARGLSNRAIAEELAVQHGLDRAT